MDEQHEDQFELCFDINGILALKHIIDYSIERWPGAPQRPVEEQEFLWHMRDLLAKCVMEHSFHNLSVDRDK
jgi:hypothetical protein